VKRAGPFAKNLLLAGACTVLVLVASEALLRAFYRDPVRTFPRHTSARTKTAEYDVEMATNAEGFRDVEHERTKPAGVYRIAVIGDSFVAGSGVAFEARFSTRLRDILSADGRRIEVLNFGVSGTGPVHHLRVWRRVAARYRPDLVVVCLYAGNDASDALREAAEKRPRFVILDLARRAAGRWRRSVSPRADAPAPADTTRAEGWNAFGLGNPARVDALLEAARARGVPPESVVTRLAAVPDSLLADALTFRSNPFNLAEAVLDPESLRDNLLLRTPDLNRGWDCIEAALRELREETTRAEVRLVLVCAPAGPQVGRRYWWMTRLGVRLDDRVLDAAEFQDRLARFAADEGVPLVDPLPEMRSRPDQAFYFEQDGHWNPTGHETTARALAAAVGGLSLGQGP
jgi:lysophospholipase L1-like esterase